MSVAINAGTATKATMRGADSISGSLAECYVDWNGKRFKFMSATKLEAKMEKIKAEVPILGKTGRSNKATGWKGTGSATFHFNTSKFREMLAQYKTSGKDVYFDMVVVNEDPTSSVGLQSIVLKGCNLDGGIIAKFDAGAEYLEEDIDFTFEDWQMKDKFKALSGMEQKTLSVKA